MEKNLLRLLDAGITTARDLGSRGLFGVQVRDRINSGSVMGPRLQVAHAPLTVPGGHAHAMGGVAQGIEGVRAEVRKRAAEGADLIKIMSTGGFMTAGSHPSQARYTTAELAAVVDEAKKFGMPVTTHATGTEGIERAVDARLSCIEHCSWMNGQSTHFEEHIALKMVKHGIAVCPTMNTACVDHNYFCPWDNRAAVVGNLTSLRQAGVRMIVGTDAGIPLCHFERYVDGLTVLRDAGYSTREILASATETAAEVCGLAGETGAIRRGLAADLLAVGGNPLERIEDCARVVFVMARGREHVPTPIAAVSESAALEAVGIAERLRKGAGLPVEFREVVV
jgi:imidazolonepropionase-like amidohydrolase